jgi:hypothetical protein
MEPARDERGDTFDQGTGRQVQHAGTEPARGEQSAALAPEITP